MRFLECSDGLSTNSDFSSDSQNSQMSADFSSLSNSGPNLLLTPTTFIAIDGLNSGVPTRTTATLTPTTLLNIEQTFIELQKPESHKNEAGFVPPLVHSIGNNQYIPASEADMYQKNGSWQMMALHHSHLESRPTPPVTPNTTGMLTPEPTRRNMGGRKPAKDPSLSPEEAERRKVRRERNKMAAARCRKRRVDHTNSLINETEILEQKRQALQTQLQDLQVERDELEFLLDSHKASHCCRLLNRSASPPDVKPYIVRMPDDLAKLDQRIKPEMCEEDSELFSAPPMKRIMLSQGIAMGKPNRPSSLNVSALPCGGGGGGGGCGGGAGAASKSIAELGISINTPSTGIHFNFDSLMGGGTGLTPVSAPLAPTCSTQQRNIPVSAADMSSPDTCGPPKLVSL